MEDLSKLNSQNIWNMDHMFSGCTSIKKLNLSSFNYSYTKSFSFMFNNCINLEVLDISNFKGSTIENQMDFMFNNCQKLRNITLNNLNLFNTTNISYMFNGCTSLISVIISNLIDASISDYSYMFNNCISLSHANLTYFKTSNNVNNTMKYMFKNCYNLTSIDFSNLDISFTLDHDQIFKSIDNIHYLNLSHLKAYYKSNLSYFFANMSSLISIDLSKFKGPIIDHTLEGMFMNCNNLKKIDLGSYDFQHTHNISGIFKGCNEKIIPKKFLNK